MFVAINPDLIEMQLSGSMMADMVSTFMTLFRTRLIYDVCTILSS